MSLRQRKLPRPLTLETLETREVPATAWVTESFQTTTSTGLPAGWTQWSNDHTASFQSEPAATGQGDAGRLTTAGRSNTTGRAWVTSAYGSDLEVSGSVYLNSTVPVQVFARGRNLSGTSPTYYAASIVRGTEVELLRVVNGTTTRLGSVKSADYTSGIWVRVSVQAIGDRISVQVFRPDTSSYLNQDGKWTRTPTMAVQTTDGAIRDGGQIGIARLAGAADRIALDRVQVNAVNTTASADPMIEERFTSGPAKGVPSGWSSWTEPGQTFRIYADDTLREEGGSTGSARAWVTNTSARDVQVSSSIYVDSLVPAGVFLRGTNLNTSKPSYYGATVVRGVELKLYKVSQGQSTLLGSVKSSAWVSGQWLQISLAAQGNTLRVQVLRTDTGQYLNASGSWGTTPAWALTRTDSSISQGGSVGISRSSGYAGQIMFDNVIVTAPAGTTIPTIPTEQDKPTSPPPPPQDTGGTPVTSPPVPTSPPPTTPANPSLPVVPRTYDWIRVANLAYYGTPFGPIEQSLLQAGVDLVIPNLQYQQTIASINPDTPQFIYTNLSNLYLGLLTDWNEYADRTRSNREDAFYHVTRETPFNGSSPSSIPVEQFWGVYRTSGATSWTDMTREARENNSTLAFGQSGSSMAFGYVEKYRELNVALQSAAASGWRGTLEYVAAVDAQGRPTLWKTLAIRSDGTAGMSRNGTITFDPPRDWVAASIGGSARLFYARMRTTSDGIAPVAKSVLGREYTVNGTIPAFDSSADKDGDGYLNDAEYARRRSGFNARFEYESRLFYPYYGEMRYATNVSAPAFRAWAVDYHVRVAKAYPLSTGFFVDNSIGRLAVDTTLVRERMTGYSVDYGSLLGMVNKRLAVDGKWLIANTSGAGTSAESILRNGVSYLEEFGLRPMTANTVQFEDLAAIVAYRRELSGGRAYEILDSLPTGGFDANDPRLQIATLAMYYLVADPDLSFLMINGGNEPSSSWTRHWIGAITFDVGRPRESWSVFAAGSDPANATLDYKVYQREYENALVLYKPLSYTRGTAGTTANNTATTHVLDGWYRPLNADGSLGKPVNRVTLRNGEGAIMVKA